MVFNVHSICTIWGFRDQQASVYVDSLPDVYLVFNMHSFNMHLFLICTPLVQYLLLYED